MSSGLIAPRRMIARSPYEAHRAATPLTPLELFFDLVFVVAIAEAGSGLHHAIAEAHALEGVIGHLVMSRERQLSSF
jgi:low temperature requirement protein LtrA